MEYSDAGDTFIDVASDCVGADVDCDDNYINVTTSSAEDAEGDGFGDCMNAKNDSQCPIVAVLKVGF